jgi:hypothetical protein
MEPAAFRPVDGSEQAGHASDRRREEHDDDEGDHGAVEDFRRVP